MFDLMEVIENELHVVALQSMRVERGSVYLSLQLPALRLLCCGSDSTEAFPHRRKPLTVAVQARLVRGCIETHRHHLSAGVL